MGSATRCVGGGLFICFTCLHVPYSTVTLITWKLCDPKCLQGKHFTSSYEQLSLCDTICLAGSLASYGASSFIGSNAYTGADSVACTQRWSLHEQCHQLRGLGVVYLLYLPACALQYRYLNYTIWDGRCKTKDST
jgi:hypothetical protein